ncbi:MAG: formate dehydrogenase accessory sulfurtransferase FdhD [Desulfatiglandales bacterium]
MLINQDNHSFHSYATSTQIYKVILCEGGLFRDYDHDLIGEQPLLIRLEGRPYSVVMRTPGEEIHHAAGFCLGEGLVDSHDDFLTISYSKEMDPNVIDVKLTPERLAKIPDLLDRKRFTTQTSCGIHAEGSLKDLYQGLSPAEDNTQIGINRLFHCVENLSKYQNFYERTRGSHAAMLFDHHLDVMAFSEDVSRHNALDKAIGRLFLKGDLSEAFVAILSSRVSYELVQKSARARLPIIVSKSRPTALAAEMGHKLNMTIACAPKEDELILISGENRIIRN